MMSLLLFIFSVFAGEINVYVEPLKIYRDGTPIINYVSDNMIFQLASQHIKSAQQKSEYGWEYIEDSENVSVYDENTIKYKFEDCNYISDGLGCSIRNKHYYLKTSIELREDEALITQQLFDKKGRIISSGMSSSKKIIKWIRQQEITVIQNQTWQGTQTITNKPKEELPLKWEIPWRFFSDQMRQMSMRLWVGVKLQ